MYEGIVSIFRQIPDPRKGNGILHDLSAIDPKAITESFTLWAEAIRQKISGEVVAIDGKTI